MDQLFAGFVLALVQFIAALPWLTAAEEGGWKAIRRDRTLLASLAGGLVLLTVACTALLSLRDDSEALRFNGRVYGAILHLQLIINVAICVPAIVLAVWPKGGAILLATFRECWRQPMFWLIVVVGVVLLILSTVVPYFTFGEDYKMMKQLGFDLVLLASLLFGLLAAGISINEEIEGRTAITVVSKPVSRRQFLLGKYLGVLLGSGFLALLLGWAFTWALYMKPAVDYIDDVIDPVPTEIATAYGAWIAPKMPTTEGGIFAKGAALWLGETSAHHLGMALTFGQVMVLLAVCAALATRVPFIVNVLVCFVVYLLANLAPVLVRVTERSGESPTAALQLVGFIARVFNAVLPGFEYFNVGPAIIRDAPLSAVAFAGYAGMVLVYSVVYSAIALLIGLLLFEDRDLA